MGKKEAVSYRIEREYLSKYTKEELLIRIVKSHIQVGIKPDQQTK